MSVKHVHGPSGQVVAKVWTHPNSGLASGAQGLGVVEGPWCGHAPMQQPLVPLQVVKAEQGGEGSGSKWSGHLRISGLLARLT